MTEDNPSTAPSLDPLLTRWLARQMVQEARVSLVDVGAEVDSPILLTDTFIDLPLVGHERHALASLCADVKMEPMGPSRWLLVGGAGSGKTTLSTMFAQVLRRRWVQAAPEVLPTQEAREAARVCEAVTTVESALGIEAPRWLPLRIDLPTLAGWMASAGDVITLARFLAEDLASLCGEGERPDEAWVRRELLARGDLCWIFDGLDEVPTTANRDAMIRIVRDVVADAGGRWMVTTRPQGYAGEFDDLTVLQLAPLEMEAAQEYAEKLVTAWLGQGPKLTTRLAQIEREFARPELADLMRSPLHVAMAALLVARDGQLPTSRWLLLDRYVSQIFGRELRKNIETGVRPDDERVLRVIHARAGLVLHVRAARAEGARPLLRPSELRRMIEEKLREGDTPEDEAQVIVERLLRFADERLVLLLRESANGYGFAVRSLQEFFAAEAFLEAPSRAAERVRAVALDPHWLNVVLLLASRCMLAATPHEQDAAIELTAGVCEAIDAGELRREAAHARLGARLALAMLRETEGATWAKLHNRLWEVVLRGVEGPLLYSHAWGVSAAAGVGAAVVWSEDGCFQLRVGRVLAAWKGTSAERRRASGREIAARLLDVGGEQRRVGIDLLAGLLDRDDEAALAQMRGYAPWPTEEARLLVQRLLEQPPVGRAPVAAHELVEQMPDVFTLGHLARFSFVPSSDVMGLDAITLTRQVRRPGGETIRLTIGETGISAILQPLIDAPSQRWSLVEEFASARTASVWQAWARVARFQQMPSAVSLADALEGIVWAGDLREFWQLHWWLSWPLAVCIRVADSLSDLSSLASRVRAGELGDVEAWRRAEVRWREEGTLRVLEFVASCRSVNAPWRIVDGEVVGFPIYLSLPSASFSSDTTNLQRLRDQLLDLVRERESVALRPLRHLQMLSMVLHGVSFGAVPIDVAEAVHVTRQDDPASVLRCLEFVLPDLHGPDRTRWIETLDAWGQRFDIYRHLSPSALGGAQRAHLAALADAVVPLVPGRAGLLVVLLSLLHYVPATDLASLRIPALGENDSPRLHATAAVLRLLAEPLPESLADVWRSLRDDAPGGSFDFLPTLASILAGREPSDSIRRLAALYESAPDDAARGELAAALHAQLRRDVRPSFATAEDWRAYGFPGTFPGMQPPAPAPVRIASIDTITNLRLFNDTPRFLAPLPKAAPGAGQWVVLLGENGVGKTTLLRALSLCLAPSGVGTKLLDDRLPMVRNGGGATIRVTLDTGSFDARVEREGTPPTERVVSEEARERPWVVGYGVRRGNARGESDREPEPGAFGALHTLFERPGTLYNAVTWILDLRRRVLEEEDLARRAGIRESKGPERRTWDAVERALRRVLLDDKLEIEPRKEHLMIRHSRFGLVRLDALSDGYLTTAGWVIDLIARWVERQRAAGEPVGDLLREMVGVVLMDEIDLHLHPIWQMRIIEDVRALFPRLSFVVTTHNPLTLQGARRGEVFVMRRDEDGVIEVVQHDVMPGYNVERVLLEQFGVEYTFDRETRRLLAEYRALREQGVPEDNPRRRELEEELSVRLGPVGRRVQENLRGPADKPKKLSPEEAEEYRRERRARRDRS